MPWCASRPPTAPGASACCATLARPPFALERLRELDLERLLYDRAKPGPGRSDHLILTPLELLERLAASVPPPRIHRHRYFGVLASHSPLRAAVTAPLVPPAPRSARKTCAKCADQPVTASNRPLTRTTEPPTLRLA